MMDCDILKVNQINPYTETGTFGVSWKIVRIVRLSVIHASSIEYNRHFMIILIPSIESYTGSAASYSSKFADR
jgi:hypothetical protein